MATNEQIESLIKSALALPAEQRLAVMDAIHVSLSDPAMDHGPEESADEVAATWKGEIADRIADVESGRVKMVPAEDAEGMVRSNARPPL